MTPANAKRTLAFLAALALVAAFVVRHSHPRAPSPHAAEIGAAGAAPARASPNANRSMAPAPQDERLGAPTADLIAADPAAAATRWQSRAWNVLHAKNRALFGDDVARLMQLPYNEAWDELVAKAKDGNIGAGTAVMQIATICKAESTRVTRPGAKVPAASHYFKNLPDAWKPFVDRLGELHDEDHERLTKCEGVGDALDLAMLFFDRFFTADNPEAEVEIAGSNEDHAEAIADLRAILARHDIARGRAVLGDLLMQSTDANERAEGRAMLEALAPGDPGVATRLGYCLENGCGGAAPEPDAARAWLEKSAGAGDEAGLMYLVESLDRSGDHAAAWAWSRYGLELALGGCFEMFMPSYMQVAVHANDEAKRKAILTPSEQNAGLAIGYAISGRWEKQARERLSCD